MLLFGAIVVAIVLICFWVVRRLSVWKRQGVPQYDLYTAFAENFNPIRQHRPISENIEKIYQDFPGKRYCGHFQLFFPHLVLRDLDLLKQITVKDFDHFSDHVRFVPENTDPLWENNLFALQGEKWRDMRATLSPSFTSSKMKTMFGLVSDCAREFVRYFEEKNIDMIEVEMKDIFTRFANDVIASTAFGVTCDSMRNPNNEFYLMGKRLTDLTTWMGLKIAISMVAPKIAKLFGLRLFDDITSDFFTNLVKQNIMAREKNNIVRPDMINLLLEAKRGRSKQENLTEDEKVEKRPITDDDIVAQALIFFFAGFDSVANLMCFMAYELAVNVDVQKRLQDEIDAIEDSISYETLSKMKYLDMVVSETLRKWPGSVATERVCVKPYTIQPVEEGERPVHIKKGEAVTIPIFGLQRDPELYPNPERFDPERFSEENKGNIQPYSFMVFGVGPRGCIGNRFALMETKLTFFYVLRKFNIEVVGKTTIPLKLENNQMQLNAEGGFWLGLKKRK